MQYAKNKYEKMTLQGEVDLWEILKGYKLIMDAPKCIQMYIYDCINSKSEHNEYYRVIDYIDGGTYVREA